MFVCVRVKSQRSKEHTCEEKYALCFIIRVYPWVLVGYYGRHVEISKGRSKAAWIEIKEKRDIQRRSGAAWVQIKEKREESENNDGREETMKAERIEGGRKREKCEKVGGRQPRGRAREKLEIPSCDIVCGQGREMGETTCE